MIVLARHIVPDGTPPDRLSDYARGIFPEHLPSRKGLKKAILAGRVLVDGRPGETATRISAGQTLQLLADERPSKRPFELSLATHYEDEHLALVFKPSGLAVSGNRFRTVENALPFNLHPSSRPDALGRPLPVHRLDAPTSGLLLVAKTIAARIELGRQFEAQEVEKRYQAVVLGRPPDTGIFDLPIDGKESLTHYRRRHTVPSLRSGWLSLMDLFPQTGRTHQLRRHLSAAGYPILGDAQYGREGLVLRGRGLFLCAVELSFVHPATGERLRFSIEAPAKFGLHLAREERRWNQFRS